MVGKCANLIFFLEISGNFSLWSTAALFEEGKTDIDVANETDVHKLNLFMT